MAAHAWVVWGAHGVARRVCRAAGACCLPFYFWDQNHFETVPPLAPPGRALLRHRSSAMLRRAALALVPAAPPRSLMPAISLCRVSKSTYQRTASVSSLLPSLARTQALRHSTSAQRRHASVTVPPRAKAEASNADVAKAEACATFLSMPSFKPNLAVK